MWTLTPARGGGAGGWEEPTHAGRLGKTKTKLRPLEIVRDHFRASVSFLPFGVKNADFVHGAEQMTRRGQPGLYTVTGALSEDDVCVRGCRPPK